MPPVFSNEAPLATWKIALRLISGKINTSVSFSVVAVQKNIVLPGVDKRLKSVVNNKN